MSSKTEQKHLFLDPLDPDMFLNQLENVTKLTHITFLNPTSSFWN